MKTLLNYFFRGLLFVFPIFATFYVIIQLVNWIDEAFSSILYSWMPIEIPGLGVVTALFLIALLGFIVSRAISKPLFTYFEDLLARIPFIKIIYTALKDFIEAFVGDKKKFNKPVIVTFAEGYRPYWLYHREKPGFFEPQ
jgi:uncharacterized membrane protein